MGYAKYKEAENNNITEDGHIMFLDDVVKGLNRKSALEKKVKVLEGCLDKLNDAVYNSKLFWHEGKGLGRDSVKAILDQLELGVG